MHHRLGRLALGFLIVLTLAIGLSGATGASKLASQEASTATLALRRGVLGDSDDTHLYEYGGDSNDVWWISTFRVGYSHPGGRGRYYGLMRFDLTPVPAGARVERALLRVYADGWNGSGARVSIGAYAVLQPTAVREATWSRYATDAWWRQPGCEYPGTDRRGQPESLVLVEALRRWYEFDLTALVRDWVEGLPNNGILFRSESGTGYFAFSSCDGFDVMRRPELVITYSGGQLPTPTATRTALPTARPSATPTASPIVTSSPTPVATSPAGGVITLQNGLSAYSGASDTYIYRYSPEQNWCSVNTLKVGYRQQYAALVQFHLTGVPAGAVISEAHLELYATGWGGSDLNVEVYRLNREFAACEATWNKAQALTPWGLPGAELPGVDRAQVPEASMKTAGIRRWYSFNVTRLLQAWTDSSPAPYAFLIRGGSALEKAQLDFASSDFDIPELRPRLVVAYEAAHPSTPQPTASAPILATPTPTATPTTAPTSGAQDLTIGHITDALIGYSWIESQRLPLVVHTASGEAQIIVDTGNCTNNGLARDSADYASLMAASASVPWRAVPGPHDTPHTFAASIGPLQWSLDIEGYRLIGINTGQIDFAALDAALDPDVPCVVFGSAPLDHLSESDRRSLRERFVAHRVPLYVSGQVRENTLRRDPESGTWLLTGQRTVRCHYRIITLKGFELENVEFRQACT